MSTQLIKSARNTPTSTLYNEIQYHNKMVTTHMIDGIYQGYVNRSYQRDGFGILQTQNYDLYMGFFRLNKMHGLGLIIYPDGSMIYGNFYHGKLEGIALTDNLQQMQIGTYKQQGLVGIGFEYSYQSQTWKMSKYHRYVSIDTLRQQVMTDSDRIPQIFAIEPEILQHYYRYKTKQFFYIESDKQQCALYGAEQDLNAVYYHQLSANLNFYGAMIDAKYQGIGMLYDPKSKSVLQTGMYSKGHLHGYGMKNSQTNSFQSKGRYHRGKKQGLFMEIMRSKTKFIAFSNQQKFNEEKRQQNQITFQKQHRIYNFRQKDFLSVRHGIQFQELKTVFQTRDYKVRKLQMNQAKKSKDKSANQAKEYTKQRVHTPPSNANKNAHALAKSSLYIMKDKILSFKSKKRTTYSNGKNAKMNLKVIEGDEGVLNQSRRKLDDNFLDEIEEEQNPILVHPNHSNNKRFSFKK